MLGIYISVPFCKTKCSYCNFASGVFPRARMSRYVDRLCEDFGNASLLAGDIGAQYTRSVDSIFVGGGTPSILAAAELKRIFNSLREHFDIAPDAEITVECAPGTLTPAMIETLLQCGVNRASLGVQSFVDTESSAVGRVHTQADALADIARLRAAGLDNINVDLIAGLPHQNPESWRYSLDQVVESQVPHASVYMLEVDDESRLGRELIAGGQRYHAHHVPDDDQIADFYIEACEKLNSAGIFQYEISNFARPGWDSIHNLKYWTRQPYLGFGVDAHSMLPSRFASCHGRFSDFTAPVSLRFFAPDSLDVYLSTASRGTTMESVTAVDRRGVLEENFFLGLRLNRGIDLQAIAESTGVVPEIVFAAAIQELLAEGLIEKPGGQILRLTRKGRLLSNEAFEKFICENLPGAPVVSTIFG